MRARLSEVLVLCILSVCASLPGVAQTMGQPMWPADIGVATGPGDQGYGSAGGPGLASVSDNAGGAIVVWEDAFGSQIYAQRVDGNGKTLWATGGIAVAPTGAAQMSPRAVSDGAGGVIIAWIDGRAPASFCGPGFTADCQVAVQRLNPSGTPLWGISGKVIGKANEAIAESGVVQNGIGGAVFLWETIAGDGDCCAFFAQYVNGGGQPQWGNPTDGLQFTPNPTHIIGSNGVPPAVVSDGAGGALIAYLFYQVDPVNDRPYTALQRVLADGTLAFPIDGIAVPGGDLSSRGRVALISDTNGGAVLVMGAYNQANFADDLIVQRVDGNGNALWGNSGKPLVSASFYQEYPQIVSDGGSGWIVAWADERNSDYAGCEKLTGNCDIYAQRIDNNGSPLWQTDGVPVSRAAGNQIFPRMVSDGAGGAVVAFQDCRYYDDGNYSCDFGRDLFAQRLDSSGTALWTADGIAVSTAGWNQGLDYGTQMVISFAMVGDQNQGAILFWPDGRNIPCPITVGERECDLYTQRVSDLPGAAPTADLAVTATVAPDPAPIKLTQTYDVQVKNNGPATAHGVILKVKLPPLIDGTPNPSQGSCMGTDFNVKLCSLGDLASGATATVNFALGNNDSGSYTNIAEVHATEIDAAGGDNLISTNYRVAPDFSVAAASSSATVTAGGSARYDFTITSQYELLNETPVMSCSGLPAKSSCSFTPPTQVVGTLDLKTTLTIHTTAPQRAEVKRSPVTFYALALMPLLGIIVTAGCRGYRRFSLVVLALVLLVFVTACGSSGEQKVIPGTPPGSYDVTITAATSAFSHSIKVTLVVQ